MAQFFPTAHIDATPADFAPTVLMPGDPLRAQMIANRYLENARLVNNVRGVQGYTGSYRGRRISVMASGMGMPSAGIYSYELFHFFGVQNILRVGTAGAMSPQVQVRDIVIGMGACTDSGFAAQFHLPGTFAPIASYPLLRAACDICERRGSAYHVGNLFSSDVFYREEQDLPQSLHCTQAFANMGVLAVEMEAAAFYMNAARAGKHALAICTVSDHLLTGEALPAQERQNSFTEMIEIALETALSLPEADP